MVNDIQINSTGDLDDGVAVEQLAGVFWGAFRTLGLWIVVPPFGYLEMPTPDARPASRPVMKAGDSELAAVWSDDRELTGDTDIYFMRVAPICL